MDLFWLDKLIMDYVLNLSGQYLFQLSLVGMVITYVYSGIKKAKRLKK